MLNLFLVSLCSLFTDISSEIIYPLLPIFLTTTLGVTPAVVGIIEGFAESTASILKVFSGYFSDKFNKRKPFAVFGYLFSAFSKLLLFLAFNWSIVFFARILDRLGKGVRTAPRDALIAESTPENKKGFAFGLHRSADTFGAFMGVLLSFYLIEKYNGNFKIVFLYSFPFAICGVIILLFLKEKSSGVIYHTKKCRGRVFLPESEKKLSPEILITTFKNLEPKLKNFLIIIFIFALGNSSNQFLLLKAKDIGFSTSSVILLYLVYNLAYTLLSFPAGIISDKIPRKFVLAAGYFFYALVYFGFAVFKIKLAIIFLFILYGFYSAFTEGIEKALVADFSPPDKKATLLGLHSTLTGIGLLPASLLAGLLWNLFGSAVPFYFSSISAILCSLVLLRKM